MDFIHRVGPWLMAADPLYIYISVAAYAIIEVIFPPFPGDVMVVFAGYLAGLRDLPVAGIMVAGILGSIVASAGAFALGRLGRRVILGHRFWKRFVSPSSLKRAEGWFARYGGWTLLVSRFLPGIRSPLVMVAGMAGFNPLAALGLVSVSIMADVTVLVLGGRALGANWNLLLSWMKVIGWGALGFLALAALAWWAVCMLRRRRAEQSGQE